MADDEVRNLLIHYGGFFKTPRRRLTLVKKDFTDLKDLLLDVNMEEVKLAYIVGGKVVHVVTDADFLEMWRQLVSNLDGYCDVYVENKVYDMTKAIPEVEVEDPTVEALNAKGKEVVQEEVETTEKRKGGRKVKGKGVIVNEDDPFWSNVGTFDVNTYNVLSEDDLDDDEGIEVPVVRKVAAKSPPPNVEELEPEEEYHSAHSSEDELEYMIPSSVEYYNYERMVVNESYRILAICEASGCPWRAYWRKKKSDGFTMRLSTFNNEHRCAADTDHENRMADAVWVTTVMLEHMKVHHKTCTPQNIIDDIKQKQHVAISYWTAWSARIRCLQQIHGDFAESYKLVPVLCDQTPEQLYHPPPHTRGIGRPRKNRRRDEDEEAPNKKRRKCRLCRTEGHNSKRCKGLPAQPKGKSKAKDVESSQASNGPMPASPSQPNTRSKSKVATESPLPASPSQPSTRSKSRVASSSQPPLASPSSQPSQVPSTRSKSKVATESQPPPASPSSQPSQVPITRNKSKVATESQPPASLSQPSAKRKSICASSNQVPTSPSSQPSTRSKSKAASSSQVPPSPSSQPSTRDKSKEIIVSQPASSQPITRGKSKETTSSHPSTRDKTKEVASSLPSTRAKTKEAASSQPSTRAKTMEAASSQPNTRTKTKEAFFITRVKTKEAASSRDQRLGSKPRKAASSQPNTRDKTKEAASSSKD
ncbi:hypothetical protein IFM89_033986 [Coptis chinensis]|uniref:Transposase MuDR plant domain-containing protein n=1 Tax=Coptis chinensis TaxID=261450 RepID=A0A835MGD8_9MAGN|nr:hypothetical protein IFM89_033986 [Coptis chinensis]